MMEQKLTGNGEITTQASRRHGREGTPDVLVVDTDAAIRRTSFPSIHGRPSVEVNTGNMR